MKANPDIPKEVGNYVLKRSIGIGSFASVWEGEHVMSKIRVAIKVVDHSTLVDDEQKTILHREIAILKQIDHPFISKLFEVLTTDKFTFLVMEYAENGSILEHVNENGSLSEKIARRTFSQLITALEYLHTERHVAHRDLKAENVLLDRNLNVRLIDFGLSNSFTANHPELKTACGSPAYASPEMVRGLPYTKATDLWAAGVLLFAMVAGQLPFEGATMQELLQAIAFRGPTYPRYMSPELVDLLSKLMEKNPSERATIEKVKMHPWFSRSEYKEFMSVHFSMDKQWLVVGVNRDLVEKIAAFGMDVRALPHSLLNDEYTEETAVYFMLRREQITEHIRSVICELDRSGRPRIIAPITNARAVVVHVGGKQLCGRQQCVGRTRPSVLGEHDAAAAAVCSSTDARAHVEPLASVDVGRGRRPSKLDHLARPKIAIPVKDKPAEVADVSSAPKGYTGRRTLRRTRVSSMLVGHK